MRSRSASKGSGVPIPFSVMTCLMPVKLNEFFFYFKNKAPSWPN
jgi:hypothetical protein